MLEKRKVNENISKLIEHLKKNGIYGEYLIKNNNIESFLATYEDIISNMKTRLMHKSATENDAQFIAIYGKKTAHFLGLIPGANLTKVGMLQGIELNISKYNEDIIINLAVLPYSELLLEPEGFLITQGILEWVTDNKYAKEIFTNILDGFKANRIELIQEIPEEYRKLAENSPYIYYPKSNLYGITKNTNCPKCSYEFTADLMVKSKNQAEASTKCPKCLHNFTVSI